MSTPRQIEELRAEATYARERYHLYRAKMYGPRPTTMSRLRELERIYQGADARLRHAQEEGASLSSAGPPFAGEHPPSIAVTEVETPPTRD
jgi:hypothetical protein